MPTGVEDYSDLFCELPYDWIGSDDAKSSDFKGVFQVHGSTACPRDKIYAVNRGTVYVPGNFLIEGGITVNSVNLAYLTYQTTTNSTGTAEDTQREDFLTSLVDDLCARLRETLPKFDWVKERDQSLTSAIDAEECESILHGLHGDMVIDVFLFGSDDPEDFSVDFDIYLQVEDREQLLLRTLQVELNEETCSRLHQEFEKLQRLQTVFSKVDLSKLT